MLKLCNIYLSVWTLDVEKVWGKKASGTLIAQFDERVDSWHLGRGVFEVAPR